MRAFIAIDLPLDIQHELARWQAAFRGYSSGARWTRAEGIHLTLKFIGEVTDAQVDQVKQALAALGSFDAFPVEIHGFGFFPDARRPRVLWAGVVAPAELAQLARRVEDAMETIGVQREQRAFSPHLTLARFRDARPEPDLREAIEKQAGLNLGSFEVTEFFLYESRLRPQGSEYRKVARFPQ